MRPATLPQRLLRYNFTERVVHWLAALFYVYLLLTGLAFFLPNLYWMAMLLGGGPTSRFWHPIAGIAYTLTLVWMYRAWRKDMRTTEADRAWSRSVLDYIRNEDEKLPPAGRFNAGQKQFFWGMFWCGLALLVSGIMLWFAAYVPWSLRWLRYASILVHVVAFLFTLAGFIVHVYMGTAVVRGGFTSIIRGEVSGAWAWAHHRRWLMEVTGQAQKK